MKRRYYTGRDPQRAHSIVDAAQQTRLDNTLAELRAALEPDRIRTGGDVDTSHRCDWTAHAPVTPGAALYPHTTDEVAAILRICNAHGQPVVPQGGLSGLAGGATPAAVTDIALSMSKLAEIEAIDTAAATITVESGATLATVQRAAEEVGFRLAVDFAARETCQIGGLISTNAGGMTVLRHGTMRAQVLGLEVVLADGRVLTDLGGMLKNNTGIDLKQCFIGAEGTLGVITRAVLRLAPPLGATTTALIGLRHYNQAVDLLNTLRRGSLPLESFELMWRDFYVMSLSWQPQWSAPLPTNCAVYALCHIEGESAAARRLIEQAGTALSAPALHVARSCEQVNLLWSIRCATAEFPERLSPINFDISLPIADIGAFVDECYAQLEARWPGHHSVSFGHIADSNLHLTVDGASLAEDTPATRHAIESCVYGLTARYRGSISAEHGIGTLKKPYLHYSVDTIRRELMTDFKRWLDPNGILNPGKIIDAGRIP